MSKGILVAALMSLASFSAATADFSAHTVDGVLVVNFMGDTCNNLRGGLRVEPLCNRARWTKNYQEVCHADLVLLSTKMACTPGRTLRTTRVNLYQTDLTKEAKILFLRYENQTIRVDVTRKIIEYYHF